MLIYSFLSHNGNKSEIQGHGGGWDTMQMQVVGANSSKAKTAGKLFSERHVAG